MCESDGEMAVFRPSCDCGVTLFLWVWCMQEQPVLSPGFVFSSILQKYKNWPFEVTGNHSSFIHLFPYFSTMKSNVIHTKFKVTFQ